MSRKLSLLSICALAASTLCIGLIAGCSNGTMASGTSPSPATAASSSMLITVGDAPPSSILAAQVKISSIALTPAGGGSPVIALNTPQSVELTSLGAIQEPLENINVPAGTYNSVTVTISSAQATYLDSSNSVTTSSATVTQPQGTISLNPALTITANQNVQLRLNFNLARSFNLTGTTLSFTPSITSAAAAIDGESSADRQVEVSGTVTAISSTSITVKSSDTGLSSTFAINSSTHFSSGASASTIQANSIVSIVGAIQADGTLLATNISASMSGQAIEGTQSGGSGVITAVSTDNTGAVTSFTFVPREDYGNQTAHAPLTVMLDASTTYSVSEDAVQQGISSTAFNNTQIFPGQSVEVIGTSSTSSAITAQSVRLAAESLSGTLTGSPQGASPVYTFTLQLPASSFLTTYQSLTTLNAATDAQTQYEDSLGTTAFTSLASSANLEVHGFLLRDSSGNFLLTVADISQIQSSSTGGGDN